MKNVMKMTATICLCLILWEGYGQNIPSTTTFPTNDFVCFCYDGNILPLASYDALVDSMPLSTNTRNNRFSLEDIWKELEQQQQINESTIVY